MINGEERLIVTALKSSLSLQRQSEFNLRLAKLKSGLGFVLLNTMSTGHCPVNAMEMHSQKFHQSFLSLSQSEFRNRTPLKFAACELQIAIINLINPDIYFVRRNSVSIALSLSQLEGPLDSKS